MRKSRRWLLASMGASAVGAATGVIEASNCATKTDREPYECEVDLGEMVLPGVKDRQAVLFQKFKMGVNEKSGGKIVVGDDIKALLGYAYEDAKWEDFKQDTWCLLVVQAHVLGQLAAYFFLPKNLKGGTLEPRSLLRAWGLFGQAMSSVGIGKFVDSPNADNDRKAFKLPWMPPDPLNPTGKPRCWTVGKEPDQGCALCG